MPDYTGRPISIPGGGSSPGFIPRYSLRSTYIAALAGLGTPETPSSPFDPAALNRLHLVTTIDGSICIDYDHFPANDATNPYCDLFTYAASSGDTVTQASLGFFDCTATFIPGPMSSSSLTPSLPAFTPNYNRVRPVLANTGFLSVRENLYPGTGAPHGSAELSIRAWVPMHPGSEDIEGSDTYTYTGGSPPFGTTPALKISPGTWTTTVATDDDAGGAVSGSGTIALYLIDLSSYTPIELCVLGTFSHTSPLGPGGFSDTYTGLSPVYYTAALPTSWIIAAGLKTATFTVPTPTASGGYMNKFNLVIGCSSGSVQAVYNRPDLDYPTCITPVCVEYNNLPEDGSTSPYCGLFTEWGTSGDATVQASFSHTFCPSGGSISGPAGGSVFGTVPAFTPNYNRLKTGSTFGHLLARQYTQGIVGEFGVADEGLRGWVPMTDGSGHEFLGGAGYTYSGTPPMGMVGALKVTPGSWDISINGGSVMEVVTTSGTVALYVLDLSTYSMVEICELGTFSETMTGGISTFTHSFTGLADAFVSGALPASWIIVAGLKTFSVSLGSPGAAFANHWDINITSNGGAVSAVFDTDGNPPCVPP